MNLAICSDIPEFGGNRLADREYASRFPGAGWVSEVFRLAPELGVAVASGDVAVGNVVSGLWKASETWVVQEMNAKAGRQLRARGARPLLLTCFESPVYAPVFYDRMHSEAKKFPFRMLPSIPTNARRPRQGLTFPAFWSSAVAPPVEWDDREDVVLVASNKYWRSKRRLSVRPLQLARQLRYEMALARSGTRRAIPAIQLLDRRLSMIDELLAAGKLSVFGPGWDSHAHLPRSWQDKLSGRKISMGTVGDKVDTLRRFKFALCIENAAWPGYVTEKVIDCFVAGVVPLYLGAPDIEAYVPKAAYVDLRAYETPGALTDLVSGFNEERARSIIAEGRTFLASRAGELHSFEEYARWLMSLLEEVGENHHAR